MNEIIKSHCNKCQGETNQEVLHKEDIMINDDEHGVWCNDIYQMLKCRGCDSITLKHTEWFSENYDERGNPAPDIRYYPPAISRREPKWLSELDWFDDEQNFIRDLMKEIYSSLHNNSRRLATMGSTKIQQQKYRKIQRKYRRKYRKYTKYRDTSHISEQYW